MSSWTTVILSFGALEDFIEVEGQPDRVPIVERINDWLKNRGFAYRMKEAAAHVWVSEIKSLNDEEFISFVIDALPWNDPAQCVLTVYPEHYGVQIYRPKVPR